MSQWQELIRNHVAWQSLQSFGPLLDQAASRDGIDSSSLDLVERMRTANAFSGRRLASSDPALVYQPALDGLGQHLQSSVAEVQAYLADGQPGHLVNANNSVSEALANLARLVAPDAPEELTALAEAASAYRVSMERALSESQVAVLAGKKDVESLAARVAELTTDVAAQRMSATTLISEIQGQFSTSQEGRAREFTDQQAARQKDFSDAQAARQGRFDELHASFGVKLNEQDAEFTKQREAIQLDAREKLAQMDADYRQSAAAVLQAIESHKLEVEKLVGVIGTLGVTSGYQKAANSAKNSTVFWQGLTLTGFVVVIAFAYKAFLPAIEGDFSWEKFAGRVVLTIAVGVFAAYAAAQADRYMESERRNRKLALELEAVGPYLAPLPEAQQQAFRLALGERTFGKDELRFGDRGKSPATVIDVVMKSKEFRDFVTDLVRAARQG